MSCARRATRRRRWSPARPRFDHVYERAPRSTTSTAQIVDDAGRRPPTPSTARCVYAVPGSPVVAERTVELLLAEADGARPRRSRSCRRCRSSTWPGPGSGIDPIARGGARRRRPALRRSRRPASGARCSSPSATRRTCSPTSSWPSTAASTRASDADAPVVVLQRLGLPDEAVFEVPWTDLDRVVEPDHLTSLYVPAAGRAGGVARCSASSSWSPRCGASARGTASRPTSRCAATCSRRATRCSRPSTALDVEAGDGLRAPRGGARRPALPGRVPRHARHRGGPVHPGRRGHDGARQAAAPPPARVRRRRGRRRRRRGAPTGSRSRRPRRAASSVFDGDPGALPALLYALKVQKKAASLGLAASRRREVSSRAGVELRRRGLRRAGGRAAVEPGGSGSADWASTPRMRSAPAPWPS